MKQHSRRSQEILKLRKEATDELKKNMLNAELATCRLAVTPNYRILLSGQSHGAPGETGTRIEGELGAQPPSGFWNPVIQLSAYGQLSGYRDIADYTVIGI